MQNTARRVVSGLEEFHMVDHFLAALRGYTASLDRYVCMHQVCKIYTCYTCNGLGKRHARLLGWVSLVAASLEM